MTVEVIMKRHRMRCVYNVLKLVFYTAFFLIAGVTLILVLQIVSYIVGLYCKVDGEPETDCIRDYLRSRPPNLSPFIPRHIHQIYFSRYNTSLPKVWEIAKETWQDDNPGYKHTLWDAEKFRALLRDKYPDLESLYDTYEHWVSRVDVAKLVILHHYGGLYIDMDVRSRKPLTPLYYAIARRYDAVLYRTLPFGVASDFMASKTGSQFMAHVLCGLKDAQRSYILPFFTAMLSSGPLYIYLRYLTYGHQQDVKLLDEVEISRFVRHIDGRTWHQWDGAILWWIFTRRHFLMKVFLVCLCAILFYKFYLRRHKLCYDRNFLRIRTL